MKFKLVEKLAGNCTYTVMYQEESEKEPLTRIRFDAPKDLRADDLKKYIAKINTIPPDNIKSITTDASDARINISAENMSRIALELGVRASLDGTVKGKGLVISETEDGFSVFHTNRGTGKDEIRNCRNLAEVLRFIRNYIEDIAKKKKERP